MSNDLHLQKRPSYILSGKRKHAHEPEFFDFHRILEKFPKSTNRSQFSESSSTISQRFHADSFDIFVLIFTTLFLGPPSQGPKNPKPAKLRMIQKMYGTVPVFNFVNQI